MPFMGLFWGGHSYAMPSVDDAETFDSIEAAGEALVDRYMNRSGSFPCVGDEAIIDLFPTTEDGRGWFDHAAYRITVTPTVLGGVLVADAVWAAERLM